ncbi:T9SS type A sorting domain-containing protein [Mangrovimonas aestuarii]|uniref:T9SS type A sorting domain-containing protein n=1 Tax=Mangrovimonas aestuarii TaxID=3018443 RepID=UPI002379C946|nr:T9SS type A sorting domain-containing protein [Mangrovimonas aestuarii]
MKTKFYSKLNNRLLLVLVCFALDGINSYGQIVYTDIEPDFTSTSFGDYYDLDLNNDGTIDFEITSEDYWDDGYWYLTITGNSTTENVYIGYDETGFWAFPISMEEGDFISSGYSSYGWSVQNGGYLAMICQQLDCNYNWSNSSDKYLGLRFEINGETHYGWARMDVTDVTNWTIKDYAYNSSAGEGIFAGQNTLSNGDYDLKNNIKITNYNNLVTIYNLQSPANFNLYSISGNKVLDGIVSNQNNQIDINKLANGIYILEIESLDNGYSIKKKFIR